MVVILCLCCVYWWKKNRESSYFIIIIVVSAGSRAELAKLLLLRARKEEWIGVLLSLRIGGGGIDDWEAANLSCTCVQPISGKWAVVTMTIIWLFVLDTSDVQRGFFSLRGTGGSTV